jgi:protein ImuB
MQRVAALYLPQWPIERLRRAERRAQPEPGLPADLTPLRTAAAKEQENACSVPRGGGWRPGARWAREEQARQIAALPAHQRPSMRQLGRCDEAAGNPFRPMQSDEVGKQIPAGKPDRPVRVPQPAPPPSGEGALVTAVREGNRMVVAAACEKARALGIAPGMAVAQARAQTPGLDIRPGDPQGDGEALRRLALALARRWCPVVMRDGADGLLLDITGTAHLFGGEKAMARRILRHLARRGYAARIAIADTAGAAHALARYTQGGACPPGRQRQALAPLPAAALRIDAASVELLKRLGIETIGQLAAMPRAPLAKRFGLALPRRLDQALGDAPEPLDPLVPAEAIIVQRRFIEPIATAEGIAHWLGVMVPELAGMLTAEGMGALSLELVAERIDGVPQYLRIGLARPSRDPFHLLRLLARRIEAIEPGFGIDALVLRARRAVPLGPEPVAERLDSETAPDLAPLVDLLATRIGTRRLWRTRPVESDVPERSVAHAGVLDAPERAHVQARLDDVRQLDRRAALDPWTGEWPRPARLLARPEAIDHVMAEMPDHAPRRFTWRGRSHRIVRADGPERILGEWWKREAERHSVRDYYRVEDDSGRRFWLFRRGDGMRIETGDLSWYIHGCFG